MPLNKELDRKHAALWAQRLLTAAKEDPRSWCILDTETSGIPGKDRPGVEILQIGVLWPDGEVALDSLVKPIWDDTGLKEIPAAAIEIHHITDEMVADAPTLGQLLPNLWEILHGKKCLVYNLTFDVECLLGCLSRHQPGILSNDELEAKRKEKPEFADATLRRHASWDFLNAVEWQCVMQVYNRFAGETDTKRPDQYRYQKLPGAQHGAINDCRATLHLLQKMAAFAPE